MGHHRERQRPGPRAGHAREVLEGVQRPARAGAAGLHPIPDHPEVALDLLGRRAQGGEALPGGGQQVLQEQRAGGDVPAVEPLQPGVEAIAGGGEQVGAGVVEAHPGGEVDRAQALHQAVEEGGVGDLVAHGGPRGQHAVLDAHVGAGAEAGAVPAPDGAVVQGQGAQGWILAVAGPGAGPGRDVAGEHGAEAQGVLAEELGGGGADPALAEAHPGRGAAVALGGAAGVGGAGEHGDAALAPEAAAQDQRRVAGGGQERRGDGLGAVVGGGEVVGIDLEVELEAGGRGLHHHGAPGDLQGVDAVDLHVAGAAALAHQAVVERPVAGPRRDVLQGHVPSLEGGQDAHQQRGGAQRRGGDAGGLHRLLEVALQGGEEGATQRRGVEVGLEVVAGELGGEVGAIEGLERGHGDGRGAAVGVDEEELLLDAHAAGAGLEAAIGPHDLKGLQLVEQRGGERAALLGGAEAADFLGTHDASTGPVLVARAVPIRGPRARAGRARRPGLGGGGWNRTCFPGFVRWRSRRGGTDARDVGDDPGPGPGLRGRRRER